MTMEKLMKGRVNEEERIMGLVTWVIRFKKQRNRERRMRNRDREKGRKREARHGSCLGRIKTIPLPRESINSLRVN